MTNICIIMAAGKSSRFNGFPKQNLDVGGETLLQRQVRQFKSHYDAMFLSTSKGTSQLNHPDVFRFKPKPRRWKCESLISTSCLWMDDSRITYIHGDVYFTDESAVIVSVYDGNKPCFFWDTNEVFALVIPANESRSMVLEAAKSIVSRHVLANDQNEHVGGFSEMIRVMDGHCNIVVIGDETQDFDTPQEYEDWKKGWRKNCIVRGIAKR